MKSVFKKNALFILVFGSNFIQWRIVMKKFIPQNDPGEFDFIGNYKMVYSYLKVLFLFTNFSYIILLAIFLLKIKNIEANVKFNFYYSFLYLLIMIVIIGVFF